MSRVSLDHGSGDISDSAMSTLVSYTVSRSVETNLIHMSNVSCTVRPPSIQGEYFSPSPRIKHSRTRLVYHEQRRGDVFDIWYNGSSTSVHYRHFLRHWTRRIHRRGVPRDRSPFTRAVTSDSRRRDRASAARPAPALTMYAEQNLE